MGSFKILDGAMGSELIKRGLILPEHIWSANANIFNPNMVKKIHRDYMASGAEFITTNTFRTTRRAYMKTGLSEEDSIRIAKHSLLKAVEISKEASTNSVKIVGSCAPLEDCYVPDLFPGREAAITEYSQLGALLVSAGVDILLLETMNSLKETEAALIGIKSFGLPIWVSFVLKDNSHLLSGESIDQAIESLKNYSIDCIMLNCNPLGRTLLAAENLVGRWPHKWGVYPNLGIGEPSPDGSIVEYEEMDSFLTTMEKIISLEPYVVGACCGSSPKHIQGLKKMKKMV